MYGSLDAAQRWGEHYVQVLEAGGFSRGAASPCHFFHEGLQTYILVHGGVFFIVGRVAKACAEFVARCIRIKQSCNSGSGVVTVSDSQLLGQNTDIATMRNRVRTRPAACLAP